MKKGNLSMTVFAILFLLLNTTTIVSAQIVKAEKVDFVTAKSIPDTNLKSGDLKEAQKFEFIPYTIKPLILSGQIVEIKYLGIFNLLTGESIVTYTDLPPKLALFFLESFSRRMDEKSKYYIYKTAVVTQESKKLLNGSMTEFF